MNQARIPIESSTRRQEPMRRITALAPAILVLLTALATLNVVPAVIRAISSAQTAAEIRLTRQALGDDDILERFNAAIRNVAKSVSPSVVHIDVADLGTDQTSVSSGSGWVYDDRGNIVTNAHVVRGANRISVQFADGRVERAERVGIDPSTDIAVIQVERTDGLFPMRRGTDARVEQGDRVFAFGSPFGFKFSMSEGIVSGVGRTARAGFEFGGYSNFIQTDAAVNPGNSGGPLVDIRGRLVGMNVAIATAKESEGSIEGQSAGISFAIPLPTIESVVDQLIETGVVRRGFLGIQYASRGRPLSLNSGGEFKGVGLPVDVVVDDGPAAKAGMKSGDVITHLNDQPVTSPEILQSIIGTRRPGDDLKVRVWRQEEFQDLTVKLAEMPRERQLVQTARALQARLGLNFVRGLKVHWVYGDTPAERAGFAEGQMVTSVAGKDVSTLEDFYIALAEAGLSEGKPVDVVVREGDGEQASSKVLTIKLR
jgi:serine protease Do